MAIENEDYDAYLRVQSNANLASMHVSLLRSITAVEAGSAYLDISNNQALPNIDLPLLKVVMTFDDYGEAYVYVANNFAVRQMNMALQSLVGGEEAISYFIVYDMAQLEHLALPHLVELLPTGGPYDFSEVTIGKCPGLTEFVLPRLKRVSLLQLIELKGTTRAMFPSLESLQYFWIWRSCANANSTLKIYICGVEDIMDVLLDNSDGLCGPTGYMMYSENPNNTAECAASSICQPFYPGPGECQCGSPGSCFVGQ